MGAELGVAALLILYIVGLLTYAGFLAFSMRKLESRKSAGGKLVFAFVAATFVSLWV